MKRILQVALVAALGLAGWLIYRFAFPDHAGQIRHLLDQAAAAASWSESTPALDKLAGAGRIASLCTEAVVIRLDLEGARELRGRQGVREAALAGRQQMGALRLKVGECEVHVEPGAREASAQAVLIVQLAGAADPWVNEVRVRLERQGRSWRIARLEPVRGFGG